MSETFSQMLDVPLHDWLCTVAAVISKGAFLFFSFLHVLFDTFKLELWLFSSLMSEGIMTHTCLEDLPQLRSIKFRLFLCRKTLSTLTFGHFGTCKWFIFSYTVFWWSAALHRIIVLLHVPVLTTLQMWNRWPQFSLYNTLLCSGGIQTWYFRRIPNYYTFSAMPDSF